MGQPWKYEIPIHDVIENEEITTREKVTRIIFLLSNHPMTKNESFVEDLREQLTFDEIDEDDVDGILAEIWEFFDVMRIWGGKL